MQKYPWFTKLYEWGCIWWIFSRAIYGIRRGTGSHDNIQITWISYSYSYNFVYNLICFNVVFNRSNLNFLPNMITRLLNWITNLVKFTVLVVLGLVWMLQYFNFLNYNDFLVSVKFGKWNFAQNFKILYFIHFHDRPVFFTFLYYTLNSLKPSDKITCSTNLERWRKIYKLVLLEVVAYRQHELLVGKNKTSRFDKNVTSSPETFLDCFAKFENQCKINIKSGKV